MSKNITTEVKLIEHPFFTEAAEYKEAGYHPDYCLALARWCLWNEPELAGELKRACEAEQNGIDYLSSKVEQQIVDDYKRIFAVARSKRERYNEGWIIENAYE